MLTVTQGFLDTLRGAPEYLVRVDAWRGGVLTAEHIPLESGDITFTAGNVVGTDLRLSIADPDGALSPKRYTDPLAPYGQELQVRVGVRVGQVPELVTVAWCPIQDVEITEAYQRRRRPGTDRIYQVSHGAYISVSGTDRGQRITDGRFLSREAPAGATVFAELARLAQGAGVPWRPPTAVADRAIPADLPAYDDDRAAAVKNLAGTVDADPAITADGALTLTPEAPTGAPVWDLDDDGQDDDDRPLTVSVTRRLSRDGLYNVAVARGANVGEGQDAAPLQAVATVADGPMDPRGPFGWKPYFQNSSFLTTQEAVDASARTTLARISTTPRLTVPVTIIPNPALQLGDIVTLPAPRGTVTGWIRRIRLSLVPGPAMALDVSVDPLEWAQVA